ncbi:hypothetical protein DTL70_14390 [Streptomyces diacarni]|uniref:DUF4383 domain-containing protein n=1 Tax=Streptomyces diacarni TaxID=2800381 RepID=A0A367EXQ2_9ACTN|nr:hypothetical protein [Streptomyces diacarni]RCG22908.1 hypothetical protein DTL70_14390 [Streptomyces diacarni]
MNVKLRCAVLGLLAVSALSTGAWAYFAPENWYENFPGFGRTWLPPLGPYNPHLAKDTGALLLALGLLAGAAGLRARDDAFVRITAVVWLVFNVLHLIYHAQHLHVYGTSDQILNAVGLSGAVLLSALPLLPLRPSAPRD